MLENHIHQLGQLLIKKAQSDALTQKANQPVFSSEKVRANIEKGKEFAAKKQIVKRCNAEK